MTKERRVAKSECDGCHYIFEKPDMHRVETQIGGGRSSDTTTKRYNRSGNFLGYSIREGQYIRRKTKILWYCEQCNAEYKKNNSGIFPALKRAIKGAIKGMLR